MKSAAKIRRNALFSVLLCVMAVAFYRIAVYVPPQNVNAAALGTYWTFHHLERANSVTTSQKYINKN